MELKTIPADVYDTVRKFIDSEDAPILNRRDRRFIANKRPPPWKTLLRDIKWHDGEPCDKWCWCRQSYPTDTSWNLSNPPRFNYSPYALRVYLWNEDDTEDEPDSPNLSWDGDMPPWYEEFTGV